MTPPLPPQPVIGILGTGALGGYYGACLVRAGCNVHFLCRSDADHIRRHGLTVESVGHWKDTLRVPVAATPAELPPLDLAVVAMKTTDNHALPSLLPRVLKPSGLVLVLQNGLGVEEQIAALVGPDRVLGGLCFLCANKTGPGSILHLDYGRILLGEFRHDRSPGGITPRLQQLAALFQTAGIPIETTPHLRHARWKKLVWNIPYNGLSVLLRTTTDRIMQHPPTRALVADIMHEVLALAAADQCPIDPSFVQKMLADTDRMKPYKPSMLLDHERGRPLEIDAIYTQPLNVGAATNTPAPNIAMIERMLTFTAANNRPTPS